MWIHVPSTYCPSVLEEADSISASGWRSQLLEQSAALSTKHSQSKSWLLAWKKKPWMRRLFGRIYVPSTAALGVGRFMESSEGCPASRARLRAGDLARLTPAICSLISSESWKSANRTSASSRTYRASSPSGLRKCSESFGDLATRLRAESSLRLKSALRTLERGSSSSELWPTPVANDDNKSPDAHMAMKARMKGGARKKATSLNVVTKMWSTPRADEHGQHNSQDGGMALSAQSKLWPTPAARDWRSGEASAETMGRNARPLNEVARMWPTPRAEDAESCGGHGKATDSLTAATRMWPTPRACEGLRSNGAPRTEYYNAWKPTRELVLGEAWSQSSPQGQETSKLGEKSLRKNPCLNPRFVNWLMNWPPGWTSETKIGLISFASWEMVSFQLVRRMVSAYFSGSSSESSQKSDEPPAVGWE